MLINEIIYNREGLHEVGRKLGRMTMEYKCASGGAEKTVTGNGLPVNPLGEKIFCFP